MHYEAGRQCHVQWIYSYALRAALQYTPEENKPLLKLFSTFSHQADECQFQ